MAEVVQGVLDQMVAPLRDLMDKGIFSESEIRAIVSRRRQSEYLLRRRAVRKSDFLRYIDAEVSLEKLRKLRHRKIIQAHRRKEAERRRKRSGNSGEEEAERRKRSGRIKHSMGDVHIVKHVHFIFVRALRKFREDVDLHLAHTSFAKDVGSWGRLGRIYSEALQVHPREVRLWIEAASHEFFGHQSGSSPDDSDYDDVNASGGGGSIKNARILLQRGLRVNPSSAELWTQYFALELHYIQKLKGRSAILKLRERSVDNAGGAQNEDGSKGEDELLLPKIIYKNAIKAIPDDVAFRLSFVEVCRLFPDTSVLEREVMKSIEEDFGKSLEGWMARVEYALEREERGEEGGEAVGFLVDTEGGQQGPLKKRKRRNSDDGGSAGTGHFMKREVFHLLDKATNALPTPEMYLSAIKFIRSYQEERADPTDLEAAVQSLGSLFDKADRDGVTSSGIVLEKAHYLVQTGDVEGAADALKCHVATGDAVQDDKRLTGDIAEVWLMWSKLSERLKSAGLGKGKTDKGAAAVLRMALERIPLHDPGYSRILSSLFVHLLLLPSSDLSKNTRQKRVGEVKDLFRRILLLFSANNDAFSSRKERRSTHRNSGTLSVPRLSLAYLQWSILSGGLNEARGVYDCALFQSNLAATKTAVARTDDNVAAMKDFYDACLALETVSSRKNIPQKKFPSTSEAVRKQATKKRKHRQKCLYKSAIEYFQDLGRFDIADTYRQRRDDDDNLGFS